MKPTSLDEQCKTHQLRRWSPNSFSSKCSPEVIPESFPVLMGQIPSRAAGQHSQHPGGLCTILSAPQHHPSCQTSSPLNVFWSFPSLQFRDTTQHCALKVKHRSCLIYSLLFPPTSGSHKHPKEKSIFSMAKRNSRSARGWSEAGFESGWNYSETFVRTGTAPRNQGNSLDTKQRPQNTLNIF